VERCCSKAPPSRAKPWKHSAGWSPCPSSGPAQLEDSARSEAAKETERLRTALLDSVTHELRTPLTSIKASISSLLSQNSLDPDSRKELLTIIDEESDKLNHLIEQAVEMAQLDANKVHLELKPLAVAALVEDAVAQIRAAHPGREIRVALSQSLASRHRPIPRGSKRCC